MIGRRFLHGVPAEFLSLLAMWIDQERLFLPKACFSVEYWTWFPHFSRILHVRDSDCSWIIYPTWSLYTCCFWHVSMFLCHVSFPQNLTHCLSCTCTGISSGKPTSAASRGSFLSLLLCGLCVCVIPWLFKGYPWVWWCLGLILSSSRLITFQLSRCYLFRSPCLHHWLQYHLYPVLDSVLSPGSVWPLCQHLGVSCLGVSCLGVVLFFVLRFSALSELTFF